MSIIKDKYFIDLLVSTPLFLSKVMFKREFIKNMVHFTGEVLDVGCGSSPFRKLFQDIHYTGIDIVEGPYVDVVAPADNIPFHDNRFQTILCTEVLEHVKEPREVLNECNRVMKDGGIMYITVPMTWYLHYEPYDYYRFTKYGLQYLVEKSGFEVIKVNKLGGFVFYLCIRVSEYSHKILFLMLSPLKLFRQSTNLRYRIATWILVPYQILASLIIYVFDRYSPRDARGWSMIAKKSYRSKK